MAVEFVKGWHLLQTLGEGTYGEVKLLINSESHEAVAAKVIHLDKYPMARNSIKKEICIHRMLNHQNIIKFFGNRTDEDIEYLFLEYASGGELFDKIEPDIGMDMSEAHRFFVQLISGVEYLHQKGIVHRDLKPENILLDDNDNIKISDFGMATLFRHSGNERLLNQKCGTIPYMSPEIFINKEYKAEPSDIWSCGVILVTLLAGELPWDRPTFDCLAYRGWKECKITCVPWTKIDNLVLSLLRKIMMPNVSKRYTLSQIKNHQWFKKRFSKHDIQTPDSPVVQNKRMCTSSGESVHRITSASQPITCAQNLQMTATLTQSAKRNSFSQPAQPENMFLSTQMYSTPIGNSQNIYQRLVRRMTRFFTNTDAKATQHKLKIIFENHNYSVRNSPSGQLTVSTIDKRRMPLVFKTSVIEMNSSQILVDFRLSKGNGIEFKRHFVNVRNDLKDIIVKGPITWPLAFATNSLP